jgi:hypothetical protein
MLLLPDLPVATTRHGMTGGREPRPTLIRVKISLPDSG